MSSQIALVWRADGPVSAKFAWPIPHLYLTNFIDHHGLGGAPQAAQCQHFKPTSHEKGQLPVTLWPKVILPTPGGLSWAASHPIRHQRATVCQAAVSCVKAQSLGITLFINDMCA